MVLFFFFKGTPIIHMMALLCLSSISTIFSDSFDFFLRITDIRIIVFLPFFNDVYYTFLQIYSFGNVI